MKTFTLELPAHWASYLINGDESSFEPEDGTAHRECRAVYGDPVDVSEVTFFARHHDATSFGVLACTCATYTFAVNQDLT